VRVENNEYTQIVRTRTIFRVVLGLKHWVLGVRRIFGFN